MDDEEEPSLKSIMTLLGSTNRTAGWELMRWNWKRWQLVSLQPKPPILLLLNLPQALTNEGGDLRWPTVTTPDSFSDVAEEVWARVANWLRGAPALFMDANEDTVSKDDQAAPTRRKCGLKSGKIAFDSIGIPHYQRPLQLLKLQHFVFHNAGHHFV